MGNDVSASAAVESPGHQDHIHSGGQRALPDRWCFGLAHPYMQRLIFLAGELEPSDVAPSTGDSQCNSDRPER